MEACLSLLYGSIEHSYLLQSVHYFSLINSSEGNILGLLTILLLHCYCYCFKVGSLDYVTSNFCCACTTFCILFNSLLIAVSSAYSLLG